MTFRYLYQTKANENREGEIKARSRNEAYLLLRKQGIRPYRVIGDDPWNWRPWAIALGYAVLLAVIGVLLFLDLRGEKTQVSLTDEEARAFRERAEAAVQNAPEAFRYDVWRGVNARLKDHGLEPLERPADLDESLQ